jgi:hypothetical protein
VTPQPHCHTATLRALTGKASVRFFSHTSTQWPRAAMR